MPDPFSYCMIPCPVWGATGSLAQLSAAAQSLLGPLTISEDTDACFRTEDREVSEHSRSPEAWISRAREGDWPLASWKHSLSLCSGLGLGLTSRTGRPPCLTGMTSPLRGANLSNIGTGHAEQWVIWGEQGRCTRAQVAGGQDAASHRCNWTHSIVTTLFC